MRSLCLALVLLILGPGTALAVPDAKAFLGEVRKKYYDPQAQGLKSFACDVALRSSHDKRVMAVKARVKFGYSWSAPDREDFAMLEVPAAFHKPLRALCAGVWKDILVTPTLDDLGKAEGLSLVDGGDKTELTGKMAFGKRKVDVRAVFDKASGKLLTVEMAAGKYGFDLVYETRKKLLHRKKRSVSRDGRRELTVLWDGFRHVSTYTLPSILSIQDAQGRTTSFNVTYVTVNGKPAVMGGVDPEEVKKAVTDFKKGWKSWDELEKIAQMKTLANLDHDLVSATIAKYGLRDRDTAVRKEAAMCLGDMGRRNVVPQLLGAMKPNEKYIETYVVVIQALGRIGDPRAIPALSKGWWNQRERGTAYAAARAKIDALGDIRDKRSVDAIVDVFYMVPDHALGPIANNIINSLTKLTGQNFQRNRRAWKDWWKKNRARHKFP